MHGIIAGLWSSLSGAGRFVSRLGSGIMVDHIGFDNTATIFTALQVITVSSRNSFGVVTVTWNYCFKLRKVQTIQIQPSICLELRLMNLKIDQRYFLEL